MPPDIAPKTGYNILLGSDIPSMPDDFPTSNGSCKGNYAIGTIKKT